MERKSIHRWIRRIWITGGLAFLAWQIWNVQPHGIPAGTFESTERVRVSIERDRMTFLATAATAGTAGLVFLPGAVVDPRAYAPMAKRIAEAGFPVAIVRLPFRIAPTEGTRADLWARVRAARDEWGADRPLLVAGHSRGGALAGMFAAHDPAAIAGLALIGTTHPRDDDLSALAVPVLKITASRDCVAPTADARENAARLPAQTRWMEIAGGNHAQFGHYGTQLGDCRAEVDRRLQQEQVIGALVVLLDEITRRR
jgi:pimeloyl-ACP methyl ester carboxylesterase